MSGKQQHPTLVFALVMCAGKNSGRRGRPYADPRPPIHPNFIAFLAQEAKLKESLTHLSVAV